jgi:hypothetical protein
MVLKFDRTDADNINILVTLEPSSAKLEKIIMETLLFALDEKYYLNLYPIPREDEKISNNPNPN